MGSKRWDVAVQVSLALLVAFRSTVSFFSPDTFIYLAMGKNFLFDGQSIFVDQLSLGFQGQPITPNPWLYSILTAAVESVSGWTGLFVLQFVAFAFPVALFFWLARRRGASLLGSSALGLAFASAIVFRVQLRPELLSLGFLALFTWGTQEILRRPSLKRIAVLGIGFVVWSQFHVTSAMTYPLVAAAAVQWLVWNPRPRPFASVSSICAVFLLLGFLTPSLFNYHPLQLINVQNSEWVDSIAEFAATKNWLALIQWLIYAIAAAVGVWALLTRAVFVFLTVAVLAFYTLSIPKMLPHFAVVLFILAGEALVDFESRAKTWGRGRWFAPVVLAAIAIAATMQWVDAIKYAAPSSVFLGAPVASGRHVSEDVASFMREHHLQGNTFNELGLGGYLAYALRPSVKLYIDQRLGILYPFSHFTEYQIAERKEILLSQLSRKHSIAYIVASNHRVEQLIDTAARMSSYSIRFIGQQHSVFVRTDLVPGYPEATRLMYDPACIAFTDAGALQKERQAIAEESPGGSSTLLRLVDIALAFKNSGRAPEASINDVVGMDGWSRRLIAHLYLRTGRLQEGLSLYSQWADSLRLTDYFDVADALVELKDPSEALRGLYLTGPRIYKGSLQKARQLIQKIDAVKAAGGTGTPPNWLESLRASLPYQDPRAKIPDFFTRHCRD